MITPGELAESILAEIDEFLQSARANLAAHEAAVKHYAEMVRALQSAQPPQYAPVKYHSQWDADATKYRNDCGPACLRMILDYKGVDVTTDELAMACGMSPDKAYTTGPDIERVASQYGVTMHAVAYQDFNYFIQRTPCVVLVHYGSIPITERQDPYEGGHFLVLLSVGNGSAFYHDPDWQRERRDEGAFRQLDLSTFKKAMDDCYIDGNPSGYGVVLA